jgi:aromatic-amino-acid transaminase
MYYGEDGNLKTTHAVQISQAKPRTGAIPYLPVPGLEAFRKEMAILAFGADSAALNEGRIATVQTHGGGEALSLGAEFLISIPRIGRKDVFLSTPSWDNHPEIFIYRGFNIHPYRFAHPVSAKLDFQGMLEDLRSAPEGAVALFQASGHNPSGLNVPKALWQKVLEVVRERNLLPFFDLAYQGLVAGPDQDAWAIRYFTDAGVPLLVAQSGSKTFGLYGERVGALHVVTRSPDQAEAVVTHLNYFIRREPSSCSTHGASVVADVLGDPTLKAYHFSELDAQRQRMADMRRLLLVGLAGKGVVLEAASEQEGMFMYGLPPQIATPLRQEHGIYILDSGRVCIAGINMCNLGRVVNSIALEISKLTTK